MLCLFLTGLDDVWTHPIFVLFSFSHGITCFCGVLLDNAQAKARSSSLSFCSVSRFVMQSIDMSSKPCLGTGTFFAGLCQAMHGKPHAAALSLICDTICLCACVMMPFHFIFNNKTRTQNRTLILYAIARDLFVELATCFQAHGAPAQTCTLTHPLTYSYALSPSRTQTHRQQAQS